jgi:hypothetical protein
MNEVIDQEHVCSLMRALCDDTRRLYERRLISLNSADGSIQRTDTEKYRGVALDNLYHAMIVDPVVSDPLETTIMRRVVRMMRRKVAEFTYEEPLEEIIGAEHRTTILNRDNVRVMVDVDKLLALIGTEFYDMMYGVHSG